MRHITKGTRTRRAVLDAAIVRFARDGYRATSVADVARDAGVGGTVPYAYFPSKEALFLAALDEDAALLITEGIGQLFERHDADWRQTMFFTLVAALDDHPLARRVLAGLEPDVTDRVLEIDALTELRKACIERLTNEQLAGAVRPDIDVVAVGNGVVTILLSLLMSVVQVGPASTLSYASDVVAVFEAAIERTPPTPSG